MTSPNSTTSSGYVQKKCGFPDCDRPARQRAGESGGKPPIYCDLVNPATGKLAHTPLLAARERARRQRQHGASERVGEVAGEAPATAARVRSVGLLEQFRATGEQLTDTLVAAIEAMTAAGDPENVSVQLAAAERRFQSAEVARDQAHADAAASRQAADEAATVRDEAISELEALEATLVATRAELEQARSEHAGELEQRRIEADRQLSVVRAEATAQVNAAEQRAAEQIQAAHVQAQQRIQVAEAARDQALADAAAAKQTATDATSRAEEAREELRQARTDHRDELAALRREHRDELSAERQRADHALDAVRAEHRRETETLQAALTTLRDQFPAPPTQPAGAPTRQKR